MTIISGCLAPPPAELLRAVHEFNRGEWFECHETLEELWVGSVGELRHLYQGLLQIAVALHHWKNGNYSGAVSLFEKGADHLRRLGRTCQGIDVGLIVAEADRFQEALTHLGPERMSELDQTLLPSLLLSSV
ncbi:MAG: DUF309 domain-containing protein [Desulfuromonadales bacterium]|nr:DUF309 domain-containing protein [Desulfuromonadales bacterium]